MLLKKILKEILSIPVVIFRFQNLKRGSILMYHSVGLNTKFSTVTPTEFEKQIQYLLNKKYKIIRLADVVESITQGQSLDKCVALTFDDGYLDFYSCVFPLLKKYKIPASVFVATDYIGKEMRTKQGHVFQIISESQIKEMISSGYVDVMPHTKTHPKLSNITHKDGVDEIIESQSVLTRISGRICNIFAYPFGNYTPEIVSYLEDSPKWIAAVTVKKGYISSDSPLFLLPRNSIDSEVGMMQFRCLIR